MPAGRPVVYYLAGNYPADLVFDFEGHKISGTPFKFDGSPLCPGDPWEGPHQGIPYKLKAGGKDISFEKEIRPNVTREYVLSSFVGADGALRIASKIYAVIGFQGGRFYINEFRQLFTGMPYRYIGALEKDDPWFPMLYSSRLDKYYCKVFLSDVSGHKTKQGTVRGERKIMPSWLTQSYFLSCMRLKQTVAATRGFDHKTQVLIVKPEDHTRMIRIFFANKIWVLQENYRINKD